MNLHLIAVDGMHEAKLVGIHRRCGRSRRDRDHAIRAGHDRLLGIGQLDLIDLFSAGFRVGLGEFLPGHANILDRRILHQGEFPVEREQLPETAA